MVALIRSVFFWTKVSLFVQAPACKRPGVEIWALGSSSRAAYLEKHLGASSSKSLYKLISKHIIYSELPNHAFSHYTSKPQRFGGRKRH